MYKLYLDCDGVILDTINKSYQMLQDRKIEEASEIRKFYQTLDWENFIYEAGEIDNSIRKIQRLINSGIYDVKILTHVNSQNEGEVKIEYFKNNLPNTPVIIVPRDISKAEVVDARGAILVDDYIENLNIWYKNGGIPIKFSDSGKECQYTSITDLLELLNVKIRSKVK